MEKKMNKFVIAILSVLTTLCLLFGIGFTRGGKNAVVSLAETTTGGWEVAFGTTDPATYDETTGLATMCPNVYGERLFYNQKLTLDGLTVTIGSTNMTAGIRFGFGFTNLSVTSDGNYTPETGPFNVNVVPSEYTGQDCVYFNNTHASGTIVYVTDTITPGVCSVDGAVQNRFISAPSTETTYSITFTYRGAHPDGYGDYWSATITLDKGNTFCTGLTSATVDFLDSQISAALDADGKCYLSAWGMANEGVSMGDFYIGITTAEEKALLATADTALATYETARTAGASVLTEREAALDAIATLPTKFQTTYQEKLATIDAIDPTWVVAWDSCAAATYDAENGYSVLTPSTYGQRMYYGEKVQLDGLTVILGSSNMVASSRFGFGLTNDATGYTPDASQLNIFCVPSETSGQDSLYFNSSNASGTVVYTDTFAAGVCVVDGNVQNRYISKSSTETAYSLTFKYMGEFTPDPSYGNYWEITIDLVKGTLFQSHLSTVKVYFLESSLNGALDADGKCYLSAWGMTDAGLFYMDVQDSSKQSLVSNADAAKEAYEDAIISGVDVEAKKEAYVAAIEQLPANESVNHAIELKDLEVWETELENVEQSVSVTVSDSLTLNYKIKVPDICGATTGTLVSEMRGESVTLTEADVTVDEEGRFVFAAQEVTPQYMTETVALTFTVYNAADERTLTRQIEYSVREYCENLLINNYDVALRSALIDLLNYGAEAQKYVNANTDSLASANVSAYQGLATGFDASGATDVLAVNQGGSVTFTAVNLVLEEKVVARAKFTTTASVENLTASATIGGGAATALEIKPWDDATYCIELSDIAPTQYKDTIIFAVSYNGSVNAQCRYSVNSYVARMYNDTNCGSLVKALYSYGVGVSAYATSLTSTTYNSIKDSFYTNGLKVYGTDDVNTSVSGNIYTLNEGATPTWEFGQWASEEDIYSKGVKTVDNGVYTFEDTVKTLRLNTNTGDAYMEIRGTQEYESGRQEGESWPHILLQQTWYNSDLVRLADMQSLYMRMDYKVSLLGETKSHNTNTSQLHCAQAVWYITLQNRNGDSADDYGDYIWFGLPLYDNRYVGQTWGGYSIDNEKDSATGAVIYQVPTENWAPNGVLPNQEVTVSVNFDIASYAKSAFEYAKSNYGVFANTAWEDIYIGSMNIGIEIPGSYDIGISVSNLGLICTPNATLLPAQNSY